MKNPATQTIHPIFIFLLIFMLHQDIALGQPCTPQGDQTTYGTNNTWIGYVYGGKNFNSYKGYVTEGAALSADFDEGFGGDVVQYATQGCSILTDTFSVRYKLTKTFDHGNYVITIGGDDGYRFSIDGGATWVINNWNDHSYSTSTVTLELSGAYNLVLEYYENFINNRISFKLLAPCLSDAATNEYGANYWIGYVYEGMNFEFYKGAITKGSPLNANFDENFGGSAVNFNTSGCQTYTEKFSVRYRMRKTLPAGVYFITVGGDDGYRLSLDGGATWVINKWVDQGYGITSYSASLSGSYNMVLEYYENGGDNRISFDMSASVLPVKLISFTGEVRDQAARLDWKCSEATGFSHFLIQKSADGRHYQDLQYMAGEENQQAVRSYNYTDRSANTGTTYYRLAMVDKDGSLQYSSVIVLSFDASSKARIYPTVVENNYLFIESADHSSSARLEVFDMNGRMVFAKSLNGSGKQQVSLNLLSAKTTGTYIARLMGGNGMELSQLIVIK